MSIATLESQIHDSGILFNVRAEPVMSVSGIEIPRKMALINEQSERPLGIVGTGYKVVTNHEVVDSLLASLDRSNLDLTDASLEVHTSHNGARSMINVRLPAHSLTVRTDKSPSVMQISTLNSLDGKWKYQSKVGAIRMACLNGQILGDMVGSYSQFHNSNLSVSSGAEHLVRMLDGFTNSGPWFDHLASIPLTDKIIEQVLIRFCTGKSVSSLSAFERDVARNRPTYRRLIDLIGIYESELGSTVYTLYNALSDYVSHKKYKQETHATAMLQQQEKFAEILKLPAFKA